MHIFLIYDYFSCLFDNLIIIN